MTLLVHLLQYQLHHLTLLIIGDMKYLSVISTSSMLRMGDVTISKMHFLSL